MKLAPGSIALGLVIGIGGGLVGGRLISGGDETPAAESPALDRDRLASIEKQLGGLAVQLQRVETTLAVKPEVSRQAVTEKSDKPDDVSVLLRRLQSMIDGLAAKTGAAPSGHIPLETILQREDAPADWNEIQKLMSEDTRNRLKFKTEDEVLRCLGKPDSVLTDGQGNVLWDYSRPLSEELKRQFGGSVKSKEFVEVRWTAGRVGSISWNILN